MGNKKQKTMEFWPLNKLIPYARNARTHSPEQIEKICASIAEFGFNSPILVDGENGIIAGHGRFVAAKKLQLKEVPVIVLTHMTEAQKRAYILADNKIAELAGWDKDLLKDEISDLKKLGQDLDAIGFSDVEIAGLENELFGEDFFEPKKVSTNKVEKFLKGKEFKADPDEIPEQVPAQTKLGDIYQLGQHRLMCGDSTSIDAVEKLMDGEKAEMLFTDPPYGVNYSGGIQFVDGEAQKNNRRKLANDDDSQIYKDVMPVIYEYVDGPCYTWFAFTQCRPTVEAIEAIEAIGEMHALIIWHKTNAKYAALNAQYKQRHEPCIYWKPKGSTLRWNGPTDECTIWEIKRDARNDMHPTQKPVELAERAIGNHSAKTILDLFGGSGSTLIACEKTGRKCFMMELDPHYCDVIVARWEKFTGKKAEKIE